MMASVPFHGHYQPTRLHTILPQDMQALSELAATYGIDTLIDTLRAMAPYHRSDAPNLGDFESSSVSPVPQDAWSPAVEGHVSSHSAWDGTFSDSVSQPAHSSSSMTSSPAVSTVGLDLDTDFFQPFSPSSWPGVQYSHLPPAPRIPQPTPRSVPHSSASSPSTSVLADASPRKPIDCPLCTAHGIPVGFGRKSDFKKHLYKFHATSSLWACPVPGCGAAFDVERAYAAHVKAAHVDALLSAMPEGAFSSDAARTQLGPRMVLACGFAGCKAIFEGEGDEAAMEQFFDHLATHSGSRSRATSAPGKSHADAAGPKWTHSMQVRNLLRQSALKSAWKNMPGGKGAREEMSWEPGVSGHLKAVLETGGFGDVQAVMRTAWALGRPGAGRRKDQTL